MKIDEVKQLKDQRPFVPFEIRTADGEKYTIDHPDAVAWSHEQPRVLLCAPRDMPGVMLELALVTALVQRPVPPVRQAKPKGKSQ
jgi:hypothetical protein